MVGKKEHRAAFERPEGAEAFVTTRADHIVYTAACVDASLALCLLLLLLQQQGENMRLYKQGSLIKK